MDKETYVFRKCSKIFDEIMSDKENEMFTKAGIEPLFSAPENARVMIVGQAPGIKAQEAGKYWFDKSGDRLREWMYYRQILR